MAEIPLKTSRRVSKATRIALADLGNEAAFRLIEMSAARPAERDAGWTVSELAEACDLPISSASRLLKQLREHGWIERTRPDWHHRFNPTQPTSPPGLASIWAILTNEYPRTQWPPPGRSLEIDPSKLDPDTSDFAISGQSSDRKPERTIEEMFKTLATEVLQASQKQLLSAATAHFEKLQAGFGTHLSKGHDDLENLIKPIREQISKQQEALQQLDAKRAKAHTSIEEHMRKLAENHLLLQQEAGRFATPLRRSTNQSQWGEMELRNIVELAGMTEHCDFAMRSEFDSSTEERLQPEMVVNLPGEGTIAVDASFDLHTFRNAIECDNESKRRKLMQRHAIEVENHIHALSEKRYWIQFKRSPKVVVMFLPIESGLTAALQHNPKLQLTAMERHVLLATPTLLVGLLRSIAYGWQQEDVAANAREIQSAAAAIYDQLAILSTHISRVGDQLRRSTEAYNRAVGTLETRILPAARKIKSLGGTTSHDLVSPDLVETETREIVKDELQLP